MYNLANVAKTKLDKDKELKGKGWGEECSREKQEKLPNVVKVKLPGPGPGPDRACHSFSHSFLIQTYLSFGLIKAKREIARGKTNLEYILHEKHTTVRNK